MHELAVHLKVIHSFKHSRNLEKLMVCATFTLMEVAIVLLPVVHLLQHLKYKIKTGKNSASTGADRVILWHLDGVQQTFLVLID